MGNWSCSVILKTSLFKEFCYHSRGHCWQTMAPPLAPLLYIPFSMQRAAAAASKALTTMSVFYRTFKRGEKERTFCCFCNNDKKFFLPFSEQNGSEAVLSEHNINAVFGGKVFHHSHTLFIQSFLFHYCKHLLVHFWKRAVYTWRGPFFLKQIPSFIPRKSCATQIMRKTTTKRVPFGLVEATHRIYLFV